MNKQVLMTTCLPRVLPNLKSCRESILVQFFLQLLNFKYQNHNLRTLVSAAAALNKAFRHYGKKSKHLSTKDSKVCDAAKYMYTSVMVLTAYKCN